MFNDPQYTSYRDAFYKTFGDDFISAETIKFFKQRKKISTQDIYSADIPVLETKLHPLIKDILRTFVLEQEAYIPEILPNRCKADIELLLLGRDLQILEKELRMNEDVYLEYQRELRLPNLYGSRRFELMIAAGFKLLGYAIEFVPRESVNKSKTCEFTAISKYGQRIQIECKQRNQSLIDARSINFLSLLFKNIALLHKDKKLLISIRSSSWKIPDIDFLAKKIQEMIAGKVPEMALGKGDSLSIKEYTATLPDVLTYLQHSFPTYTTAEDSYIACHKGLYLLLDRSLGEEIFTSYKRMFSDAKRKFSQRDTCRIVYFDIGELPSEITNELAKRISLDPITGVEGIFLLKGKLHAVPAPNNRSDIVISPMINSYLDKNIFSRGLTPDKLFGFQGTTGLDEYLSFIA